MASTETAGRQNNRAVVERTGTVVKREETKASFLTTLGHGPTGQPVELSPVDHFLGRPR